MTELLGSKDLRALLFVRTLNSQGVQPTKADLNAFIEARTNLLDAERYSDGLYPRTVDYLTDARLLTYSGRRLTLTPAGLAILESLTSQVTSAEPAKPVEAVGGMRDPFVYAELLSRVDDVGDLFVVDPYLHPQDLATLLQLPNLKRVLTRDTRISGMDRHGRTEKFQIALGARPDADLRFTPDQPRELRDRLVLPTIGGEALFLGTSLGETQLTVITRIGKDPTNALRAHYDAIWDSSAPLGATAHANPAP
ncbi:hypothetical protein ACPW96_18645 [Micromonospora sp. DT81.3]|uniref:hypothetical protein n=1 Tax=Micromonospora sp. DT81.3 TaxID=3416523 RepID=UPI003CF9F49C